MDKTVCFKCLVFEKVFLSIQEIRTGKAFHNLKWTFPLADMDDNSKN